MKRFFNWLIVLGACVGAFYSVGLIVPRNLTIGSKTNLQATSAKVYALVTDLDTWPQWHPDVAAVVERPERNGHPLWRVTCRNGASYELEVTVDEEEVSWNGTYTVDGSRTSLRFDFSRYGEGARVRVTRTVDTRDPWMRARLFFWSRDEPTPIALLNALAAHLGEVGEAESI